jgi:metallophosphoesterase superfamily enzyme
MAPPTLRVVVVMPAMPALREGTHVEVRSTFDGSWVPGFEVVGVDEDGSYRLGRLSDGSELPAPFPPDSVRRERRRQTWWV